MATTVEVFDDNTIVSYESETIVIEVSGEGSPLVIETSGAQGPEGAKGDKGDKGDQGDPGVSGASYVHNQNVASTLWIVDHFLGRYPSVTVIDSAGDEVEGELKYINSDKLTLSFSAPFGGQAFIN